MQTKERKKMGRFSVDFEVVNNLDQALATTGHLDPAKVRRMTISGIVDPGATRLVLPQSVVDQLGLPIKKKKVGVKYADGRRALRPEIDDVRVFLQGRDGIFTALVEPRRKSALIGAIVLEDLDFLVDCGKMRLVPRDPERIINEIE